MRISTHCSVSLPSCIDSDRTHHLAAYVAIAPGTWSHLWFAGVRECPPWCSIVGATVTVHQFFCILHFCHTCSLCRVELVVQLPARGVRLKCYYAFFLVCCVCDTFYIVSVYFQYQASIYTPSLCRGHSWRVRLAKQETLTPPGHLVSPLVCRGPWMSTVVLYCWCHSDSASVRLYFTFGSVDSFPMSLK